MAACPTSWSHEVLQYPAMDQALDWLIALQCPEARAAG